MPDSFQAYQNYEVGDFLTDPDFRALVFAPTEELERFWADFLKHSPKQISTFEEAKLLLETIKAKYSQDPIANGQLAYTALTKRMIGLSNDQAPRIVQSRRRSLLRIAAAAAVLLMLVLGWLILGKSNPSGIQYQTAFSEQLQITLPDQTEVVLNANSMLEQRSFDDGERIVFLKGEAYFKVQHDPSRPFRVITNDLFLEVLGTSFNVNSLRDQTAVFLESGEVKLGLPARDNEELRLQPGDMASYSSKKDRLFNTKNTSADQHLAWKDGLLKFKNTPLSAVLLRLEEIFGVQFQINDPKISNQTLNSNGIPIKELETSLAILEAAMQISIKKTNENYVVTKKKK